jgi:hypothetical protein
MTDRATIHHWRRGLRVWGPAAFALVLAFAGCNGDGGNEDATTDATEDTGDVHPDETPDTTPDNLVEVDWVDEPCPGTWITLTPTPPDILLLINRSTSMLDPVDGHTPTADELGTCSEANYAPASGLTFTTWWDEAGPAVAAAAVTNQERVNQGLVLFPGPGIVGIGHVDNEELCQGSITDPQQSVELNPNTAAAIQAELENDANAPICTMGMSNLRQALELADNVLSLSDPGPDAIVIVTNEGPNCNLSLPRCTEVDCTMDIEYCDGTLATIACMDATGVTQQITTLNAEDGVRTYVVGIPGSGDYAAAYDAMAVAGGTARDGTPKYWAPTTAAEITAALEEIIGSEQSCILELASVPSTTTDVNVLVDGTPLVRDGADGFAYDSAKRAVELLGQACLDYLAGSITEVQFLAGCPPFSG